MSVSACGSCGSSAFMMGISVPSVPPAGGGEPAVGNQDVTATKLALDAVNNAAAAVSTHLLNILA